MKVIKIILVFFLGQVKIILLNDNFKFRSDSFNHMISTTYYAALNKH